MSTAVSSVAPSAIPSTLAVDADTKRLSVSQTSSQVQISYPIHTQQTAANMNGVSHKPLSKGAASHHNAKNSSGLLLSVDNSSTHSPKVSQKISFNNTLKQNALPNAESNIHDPDALPVVRKERSGSLASSDSQMSTASSPAHLTANSNDHITYEQTVASKSKPAQKIHPIESVYPVHNVKSYSYMEKVLPPYHIELGMVHPESMIADSVARGKKEM